MSEAEFIMPVAKPDALAEMQLHALRQISDALSQTNQRLALADGKQDKLAEAVHSLGLQVARLEERDLKTEMVALAKRVDALERAKDRQDGAVSVGSWLSKHAPWLLAGIAAFAAGLGLKEGMTP